MNNKSIGILCILASLGLIIMSGIFESYEFLSQRISMGLGGIGLICGALIIYLGKLLGIDDECIPTQQEVLK